jgi:hypothetical protein
MLQHGAAYFSDECAVLDREGRVYPYPKPMFVRHRDGSRTRIGAEACGAICGEGPLPVRIVLITRFSPGAEWRPRVITPGQAVLEMLACTSSTREQPRVVLQTLRRVAARALCLKGERGEADRVAGAVMNLCTTTGDPPCDPMHERMT